jgi:hypothetical protein
MKAWRGRGFILLMVGAVVIVAFTVGIDLHSIDYVTFILGVAMVLAGLVMLHSSEMKRARVLK